MRRLKTGQEVTLDVSGAADCLVCAVLSVDGARATLLEIDRSPPELRAQLDTGALAYLMFSYGSSQVALRGLTWSNVPDVDAPESEQTASPIAETSRSVGATGETKAPEDAAGQSSADPKRRSQLMLIFQVIDGVQLQERRQFARVPLIVAVKASSPDGSILGVTVTSDLSLGGAKLARRPALGEGPWRLQLTLRGDRDPVDCEAHLIRSTATHMSVRFSQMTESDRERLAAAIAAWKRLVVRAHAVA